MSATGSKLGDANPDLADVSELWIIYGPRYRVYTCKTSSQLPVVRLTLFGGSRQLVAVAYLDSASHGKRSMTNACHHGEWYYAITRSPGHSYWLFLSLTSAVLSIGLCLVRISKC